MKKDRLPIAFSCLSALFTGVVTTYAQTEETPQEQKRPNVILLIADDLGYGDLECYGAKNVETPNVNSLANEGIKFTNCHATAATSTPSRYSLLTGEYAWRRSGTDVAAGNAASIIKPEQFTMADLFHNAGYYTGAIGKWHLGLGEVTGKQDWNGKLTNTPRDLGFDYHYIQAATADRVPCVYLEQDTIANYDPTAPIEVSYSSNFEGEPTGVTHRDQLKLDWTHGHNQSIVDGISRIGYMKGGGKALWKDENIADSIVAHSVRFINEHKDEPFFLYLCTNDVHVPRWPHERFRGKNPMGLRGDAIVQFDWTVGEVMKALDDAGIADNTLLILSSDNGPILDDGYADQAIELLNGHSPAGPYRSYKYSGYEGGTMVPFIVRWPERVVPSEEPNHTLLSHIDLIGSFGVLINQEIPEGGAIDSGDMLAQFLGESKEHRPWVSELNHTRTLSVRTSEWKYLPANNGTKTTNWGIAIENGNQPYDQLFDMINDPGETTNLAESNPEVLKYMKEILKDARANPRGPILPQVMPKISDETTSYWYNIYTPLRNNRTITIDSEGNLVGTNSAEGIYARAQWKFEDAGRGTYSIINRNDGKYISPDGVTNTSEMKVSATKPEDGWVIEAGANDNCMIFHTEDLGAQLNQSNSDRKYALLNWGNGNNTTDAGCQFSIQEVVYEPVDDSVEITLPKKSNKPTASTAEEPRWYVIYTPQRENLYLTININGLIGSKTTRYAPTLAWRLETRADNTYNIINQLTGEYISPSTLPSTSEIELVKEEPANGWTIKAAQGAGNYIIACDKVQLNQTTSANSYKIFDWGGGSNKSDAGCQFRFTDITELLNPDSSIKPVSADKKATLFDMWGRPVTNPRHGVYVTSEGKKIII